MHPHTAPPGDAPARLPGAFTLIELLVVLAILTLLIALALPVLTRARASVQAVREVAAARNLVVAHAAYAADHRTRLLPGYDTAATARDAAGGPLSFPTSARYPWRLLPWVDHQLEDTVLVGQRLADLGGGSAPDPYAVSVMPSFGVNVDFVGGSRGGPYNAWLSAFGVPVTRAEQAIDPARLIVFASARGGPSGAEPVAGYHVVQPAYGVAFDRSAPPPAFGNVDPRHGGSAAVGFLDGHAALLDAEALEDATHWSNEAARVHRPGWVLTDALP